VQVEGREKPVLRRGAGAKLVRDVRHIDMLGADFARKTHRSSRNAGKVATIAADTAGCHAQFRQQRGRSNGTWRALLT
jgi:hypothetical protein